MYDYAIQTLVQAKGLHIGFYLFFFKITDRMADRIGGGTPRAEALLEQKRMQIRSVDNLYIYVLLFCSWETL